MKNENQKEAATGLPLLETIVACLLMATPLIHGILERAL